MPIITDPQPQVEMPPSIYRIRGVSMHNVAEPLREVTREEYDADGQPIGTVTETIVDGYMIVEWEAGDEVDGRFVMRRCDTIRIDGAAFLVYLHDFTGKAIAALLKLYLHQALAELGVFPAGENAMTAQELASITSFCASWLGRQ